MNVEQFSLRAPSCWLWPVVLVLGLSLLVADAASYKQIEMAVRAEDWAQLQSMIATDGGVKSDTAALCLMVAALWNNQSLAEKALAAGVSPDASPIFSHEAGETPLTYAVLAAHENMVAFLLQRGAHPNYRGDLRLRNCRGCMPLDLAVRCGQLGTARRLLEAGADPNAGANYALEAADQQGDVKMFQLLLKHGGRLAVPASKKTAVATEQKSKSSFGEEFHSLGLAELLPQVSATLSQTENRSGCRLAIIADDSSGPEADLLAARLMGQTDIQLLERQELDRVFAEKQLTRQFVSQEANYSNVAALLRADALLLLRKREIGGTKALEARFIRVHPGIVLDTVYRAAPLTDLKGWADEMRVRVAGLAGKSVYQEAVALSLLDVHGAVPTPLTAGLERTLTVLLRDRFVHNPRFVVLERAEMEKVAFENVGTKPFWTGSYLVDPLVDAALDNSGNFKLTVRLQPSGKGPAVTAAVAGQRSQPGRAVEELIQQIERQMGSSASMPMRPDVTVEANSYLDEARWAMLAKMPARAAAAAEVAWALGLQNLELAKLRVHSSEQAVHAAVSRRKSLDAAPATEPLDYAIQAAGIWDDVLQSGLLRQNSTETRGWIESVTNLDEMVTLAIMSVGPATEQIQQANRLEVLRKLYWSGLDHALAQSRESLATVDLAQIISKLQLADARMIHPEAAELRAALQDILSRHYATNDLLARAELRLALRWPQAGKRRIDTYSGPAEIHYHFPNNDEVREWLLDALQKSPGPEGHFLASAIEFEGPVTLPAERAAMLMKEFWAMRDDLARDGELFKPYYERLHSLIDNEPIGNAGYVPRMYSLDLEKDESAEKQSHEMTKFEFQRRLYLYLANHATRPQPGFDELVGRYGYRYTPDQKNEIQQASIRYAARTGARPLAFATTPSQPFLRQQPTAVAPAPDALPPLRVSRLWHPFDLGRNISPDFNFDAGSMVWSEDRLWFAGNFHDFYSAPQTVYHYIFTVDPLTMQTEVVELPGIKAAPVVAGASVDHGLKFAVRPECLVISAAHDFFALYDRAARKWQTYPEIQPARSARPEIIGDCAYLVVEDGNALLGFDLKQHTTKVLASTARRPAGSPLDDPALWYSEIWKNEADELVVIAKSDRTEYLKMKSVAQAWMPAHQTWRLLEGPARSLKLHRPPDSLLKVVGNATANGRARGTGLALRLQNQVKPLDQIPLLALPEMPLHLPENHFGAQSLGIKACYECPSGYIFPTWDGPGFWFLSKKEFESYVQRANPPAEQSRP